ESIFIGLILTATSVSISAQTLMELGFLRSKEGLTLLGAAVVDDVLGILLLALFVALAGGGSGGALGIIWIAARIALFLALGTLLAFRLLPHLTSRVERLPMSESLMTWVVVVTLFFAWAAEALGGVAAVTGAFLVGVAFSRTSYHQAITGRMHSIAYALFVPIFFVHVGLQADARTLGLDSLPLVLTIIVVAVLSKIIGCGLGALAGGMTPMQALRVGIGMISRGEVGLIIANVGLGAAIIDEAIMSVVVIMVLATTLVTPPLLRAVFASGSQEVAITTK
ncbi:MAG: cation:proton antiporter, partial [Anaerolineae bacterium]|nr:cation:proton antiporter [Anaerolineae bacterium]